MESLGSKKNDVPGLNAPAPTTSQDIEHPVFKLPDLAAYIHSLMPGQINLSLVNKFFNNKYKEVFFFPLLQLLPDVSEQLKIPCSLISVSETMELRSSPELARRLAWALSTDPMRPQYKEETALSMLESLAHEGCPIAQFELGKALYHRALYSSVFDEVALNDYHIKANTWLLKIAHHSSEACVYIADMAISIYCFNNDFEMISDLLERAIELDPSNSAAYFHLGCMRSGELRQKVSTAYLIQQENKQEGLRLYQKAADLGCLNAMVNFGNLIAANKTMPWHQVELAFDYLQQAIGRERTDASDVLGILTHYVIRNHFDFQRDDLTVSFYLKGLAYLNYLNDVDCIKEGEKFLCLAVKEGHTKALFKLIDCYIHQGKFSCTEFKSTADELIRAVENLVGEGHPQALYALGLIREQQG